MKLGSRAVRLGLCLWVIACGLGLRVFGFHLGLPAFIVKYGGSALWAVMVFLLVAIAAPRLPRRDIALLSLAVAIAVELFRLIHTPELDAFRLTTTGALLLGRIFSLWNMVAYAVGIGFAFWLDRLVLSALANPAQADPHSAS